MKQGLHEQAIQLRKKGWSYAIIVARLGISKSTVSNWLREIPYTPNATVIKRVNVGPIKSGQIRHAKKLASILGAKEQAAVELGGITKRDLWMIGLGLYIGEGNKKIESTRIVNSDPDVIALAMKWFRDVVGLEDKNFSILIHIYPDISEQTALHFWSDITKIPLVQFCKTRVDRRKNKTIKKQNRLPFGTAHITVKSCGNPLHGVFLHRRIMGWIDAAHKNLRV